MKRELTGSDEPPLDSTPTGDCGDTEGLNPEGGDSFSSMPWGNIGFFSNVKGNTFSSSLTKIGETDAVAQIELLDGEEVTIAIAD